MSDFSLPVYNPYVELCKELALPRKLQQGDRVGYKLIEGLSLDMIRDNSSAVSVNKFTITFWIPSLSDWLDIFEEEIYRTVMFSHFNLGEPGIGGRAEAKWICSFGPRTSKAYGLTREEAAARLWIVTTTGSIEKEKATSSQEKES